MFVDIFDFIYNRVKSYLYDVIKRILEIIFYFEMLVFMRYFIIVVDFYFENVNVYIFNILNWLYWDIRCV